MSKKTERRWTVMVVPHGSGASRAVEVSQTVVKALVGIGSVVSLAFLVLGAAAISRGVNITRSRALAHPLDLVREHAAFILERAAAGAVHAARHGRRAQHQARPPAHAADPDQGPLAALATP